MKRKNKVEQWPPVRIKPLVYEKLKQLADKEDTSLNQYINKLLELLIKEL